LRGRSLTFRSFQPGLHLLVEGVEGGEGAHEDGQLADTAVVVELEEVNALELAVTDSCFEAEDDGVAFGQLVGVGKVLQGGGDVGDHGDHGLAAFEAAEEDGAVEDDVLVQRLREQVDVLALGGAAEGVGRGHRPHCSWARWDTHAVPSDRFYSLLSHSLGAKGLRLVGKLNTPLYRLSGGRIGGKVGGGPVLLLTTTGRKSGQPRTAPVLYLADGERFVVINTNAGNAKTPAWSLNLRANPEAEVEVGRKQVKVRSRIAEGEERDDLWRRHMEQYEGWDYYESKLDRQPAVFVLEPR
jgi:F420H(2)-dependent quinone reductase